MDNMYMATVRFTMVSVAFSSRDISGSTAMAEEVSHRAEVMREWCNKRLTIKDTRAHGRRGGCQGDNSRDEPFRPVGVLVRGLDLWYSRESAKQPPSFGSRDDRGGLGEARDSPIWRPSCEAILRGRAALQSSHLVYLAV